MDVVTIGSVEDPLFAKVWNIYQYSFPPHEKRTLEDQKNALDNENCFIDVYIQDKTVVGFILYWVFDTFVHIEHYAISEDYRNKGMGSKILTSFIEACSGRVVFLDIDPIEDEISKRRLGFYERLGFVTNPFNHMHPPYGNKSLPKYPLIPMSHGRKMTQEEFDEFTYELNNVIVTY